MRVLRTARPKGYLCRNFSKRKFADIKIPQKKLEEWADLTDRNDHTLALASIAEFLAKHDKKYQRYADFFNLIEKHSDEEGSLSYPGGWVRTLLSEHLDKEIKYDFGQEVLAEIKSAL